ncbi:MAG: carboxymuconolactone decarboxylase family protein [Pyrinomonadaceae bacterium]|nr:carboxymuconolactone decarboxylase family protein [Sphingobacteriaceae bacterium]
MKMNKIVRLPAQRDISDKNLAKLQTIGKVFGFIPNLYALFTHSDTALNAFLNLQRAECMFTNVEKEIISLVVSQVNDSDYCINAHTVLSKKAGLSEVQCMEIRAGALSNNFKLNALIKLTEGITTNHGHVKEQLVNDFIGAGYSQRHLIDLIMLIGIRSITNYLVTTTNIEVDWPSAPRLAKVSNSITSELLLNKIEK